MRICVWAVALAAGSALAQPPRPSDGVAWLERIAKAPRETVFSGTYIHQLGPQLETSRITHVVDPTGEHERLESLDGVPREIVRRNDELTCYFPAAKLVKIDRKRARKFFPALVTDVQEINRNYAARLGKVDRVAGFDCQIVLLDPRDGFRFGHRFCAELDSGLLLRASLVSDRQQVLEQFTFTQLTLGAAVDRGQLKSAYEDKVNEWRTESVPRQARDVESGWYVKSLPAGFRKMLEVQRAMAGKASPVIQQIYSDGLASVSVFIEAAKPGDAGRHTTWQHGHYGLYVRPVSELAMNVKVLGDVPNASLQQIGNSLTRVQGPDK